LGQRPGALLDIGANVGQTLFDFLATGAKSRYIGFEPNARCSAYLSRLIQRNGLTQATLAPVALGDSAALLQLHSFSTSDTDSSAFIHSFVRPKCETRGEYIPCLRFDDIAGSLGIDRIALCKIDVEGFELEALRGMRATLQTHRPPILCEVLDADAAAGLGLHAERIDQLQALLSGTDYLIYQINKTAGGRLAGIEPVPTLPKRRRSKAAEDDCDYLFAHRGDSLAADWQTRARRA
jgi:FkbM family methyltransferase